MTRPSEIRTIFGNNLQILSRDYPSITVLAQNLGINRTQFNRYLTAESFPRPDILARICDFFEVDARILLEPIAAVQSKRNPRYPGFLDDFLVSETHDLPQDTFPSGFYRFSRRSFLDQNKFVVGLVLIFRDGRNTLLRGYETPQAMRWQSLPVSSKVREFRGIVLQQEEGISIIVSRKNAMTSSFNYLNRAPSFDNNFWVGYVTRTVPETPSGLRATRLVYEKLPDTASSILRAARRQGFYSAEALEPFHRRLLRTDEAFA